MTTSEPSASANRARSRWPVPFRRVPRFVGPLVALLAVYALFAALQPETFLGSATLVTMVRQTVVVAIASVGMTLVIVHGGIDLSVGSAVALTTVVLAVALRADLGVVSAVSLAIAVPTAAGLGAGLLIGRLRMTPFIVTLGGMSLLRGAAKGISDQQKVDAPSRGLEALLAALPADEAWMLVPPGVWIAAAIVAVAAVVLHRSRFGRHVFAVGSNEATARLCGVDVPLTRLVVYASSGLLAGVAGVMEFATLTVGDPTDSIGLELEVIAAVVIGGGSLSGGEGSMLGTVLGALLMTTIKTGCVHVGLPSWVQEIVTGGIILVAVGIDRFRRHPR